MAKLFANWHHPAMRVEITRKHDDLIALCRRFDVARLEIFGSAARAADFDPDTSDVDFLVEFAPETRWPALEQFFGLADALQQLLGRPVDLIEAGAVRNPFVLQGINRSRERVYAT
jgi:predicted nucleotidyltransferase